ncbi:MAG TPA: DUF1572 family protein [Pyrinomonadaceae bacterium]|nr:DUF1572 family protein [Pyrinomonadaceae bacterium]
MADEIARDYLRDAVAGLRSHKKLAEKALEQVSDEEFFATLDEEANSIAVILKHMAGNMFSRWTDFLTTDGEKPNRNRDMEFVTTPETGRNELMDYWERGWQCVLDAIEPLTAEDLTRIVFIRGEEHTVVNAINRQLMHYAYHIGQIVFLAKHFRSAEWKSLSIPRNRSAEFNAYLAEEKTEASGERGRLEQAYDFARKTETEKN